jgi:hypothetical protein
MKVIEFPKNRQVENIIRDEKLRTAVQILKFLVENDGEYHIVISRNDAEKLFDSKNLRSSTIITSNYEAIDRTALDYMREYFSVYPIKGNDFD